MMMAACGSGGGGSSGGGGAGGSPACVEKAAAPLGITGIDDSPGVLQPIDLRVDATGPFVLAQQIQGDVANQSIAYLVARPGGAPTTVYVQGDITPEGAGLYSDGAGNACAIVSTSTTSYVQCAGGAQQPTGLGAVALGQSFSASRIVSAPAGAGAVDFFSYGPFAALYGVSLVGSTFSPVEFFESSISYPGAAATAGGVAYACVVGSDDALGVANLGAIKTRTHDGRTYRDCRMASDGSKLYVAGVTDAQASYAVVSPSAFTPGATSALAVAPLALDATAPFEVVFFGGKPGLVQLGAGGALQLSVLADDGTLGAPRTLVGTIDGWPGQATVGPDGGLHVIFYVGGHTFYAKSCP
jgi:hypothetical protein